jgi:hypothetical protein
MSRGRKMTHTLALARTACVLIPAVDQVTFATAKKDTRAIRMFLMDAKVGIASIPLDSCIQAQQTISQKNIFKQNL